jgi:hypothetical protein
MYIRDITVFVRLCGLVWMMEVTSIIGRLTCYHDVGLNFSMNKLFVGIRATFCKGIPVIELVRLARFAPKSYSGCWICQIKAVFLMQSCAARVTSLDVQTISSFRLLHCRQLYVTKHERFSSLARS